MNNAPDSYQLKKTHKFFRVNAAIVEKEIHPGVTVTFSSEVDLSDIENIRAQYDKDLRPSYTAFVAKALAVALQEFPYANRRILRHGWIPFLPSKMQQFKTCDIAVACERSMEGIEVATFIDILRNAEQMSLLQITEWLRNLSCSDESTNSQWNSYYKAICTLPTWLSTFIICLPIRSPRLWSKWRGGAALISSPAKYGVDSLAGSWMHPLGVTFGKVKQRPFVRDGQLILGKTFTFSLNFDRRVMAGAQSARFFQRIVTILENASKELSSYYEVKPS
jgi:pyruvate/2-oxoglutarate dehydrogenase complex dihydrolipoamide acyltransferase (E2) component